MTYSEWPTDVNTRFYNYTTNPADNYKTTEYVSGRKSTILLNTRFIHNVKCSLRLNKTETNAFISWFEDTLGGCAGIFKCTALQRTDDTTPYFRFTSTPQIGEGLVYKEVTLEIEELY